MIGLEFTYTNFLPSFCLFSLFPSHVLLPSSSSLQIFYTIISVYRPPPIIIYNLIIRRLLSLYYAFLTSGSAKQRHHRVYVVIRLLAHRETCPIPGFLLVTHIMSTGNDCLDPKLLTWAEEMEAQEAWVEDRGAPEASTECTAPTDTVPSTNEDNPKTEDKAIAKKKRTARDRLYEFESKGHGTVSYVPCLVAIEQEFTYRDQLLDLPGGTKIHHFNWAGKPVYQSSRTPPEISLWYVVTPPRFDLARSRDTIRKAATKNNAEKWIDPIVLRVNHGMHLPQDADGLLRCAKGRTQKMYTPHGQWRSDGDIKQTFLDEGDPLVYLENGMMVGNGFIEGTPLRTRTKWLQYEQLLNAVELEDLKRAKKGEEIPAWYRRAHASKFRRPSSLSQSMTPMDLEGDHEDPDDADQDRDLPTRVAADDLGTAPVEPTCPRRSASSPSISTLSITSPRHDCDSLKPGWSAIKR
ncbi:hypothetical protein BJY00DRAFT_274605 [Aspergillus carlsbadensis]|nr:hypothetical protein BJY00DRAFT_274605 [Aspergillus carlsbadensis]